MAAAAAVICRNLSGTSDPEGNKDDFARDPDSFHYLSRESFFFFFPFVRHVIFPIHARATTDSSPGRGRRSSLQYNTLQWPFSAAE